MPWDRKGHYVKPGVGSTRPSVVLSVAVDQEVDCIPENPTALLKRFRSAFVCFSRRNGDSWSKPRKFECKTLDGFWGCVQALALPKYRNYVICPSASDTLTLTDFWKRSEKGGVIWEPVPDKKGKAKAKEPDPETTVFRRLVFGGNPDIIDYRVRERRYVWVSGQQYIPGTEDEIANSLGWKWPLTPKLGGAGHAVTRLPEERALFWLSVVQRLSQWWGENSKAPWGFTCGQLGWGILRTHIQPRFVCTHCHDAAHELEGEGKFGGRASVWFIGDVGVPSMHENPKCPAPPASSYPPIPGPLYSIDVRSMYPFLLRERHFPGKLRQWHMNPPASTPQQLTSMFGVIASVTIETSRGEYPVRQGDRVVYPTGRFTTVLCGPELDTLRKDGRVIKCHRMALYTLGKPFSGAAGALIEMRERARAKGDTAWEMFAKLLANSIGGKLGQRKGFWKINRKVFPQERWGQWADVSAGTGRYKRYRALAGLVWEWVPNPPGDGPFVAAYNYLQAWGRVMIRRIRDACPPFSVVSQDTDGLWVTREGYNALLGSKWDFGDRAGELKDDGCVPAARFYGPRHYWTPGGWTLSGFNSPHVASNGVDVTHTITTNPIRGDMRGSLDWLGSYDTTATLSLDIEGGQVDRLGWVHPPYRRGPMKRSSKGG